MLWKDTIVLSLTDVYIIFLVIPVKQAVAETVFCHPEFISGSHNLLISLDAETSSA